MKEEAAEFYNFSRWSSFSKITDLAHVIAARMTAAGMTDVRLIDAPADGRTAYGGWFMPKASDVARARLTVAGEETFFGSEYLAAYSAAPTSLMLYSQPTPEGGITAELAIADSIAECQEHNLNGRLVLTTCGGIAFHQAAMRAGAIGLVCDGSFERRFFKEGEFLDRQNEWHNYTIPPWDDPGKGFGFSIHPETGRHLRAQLAAGETVRLHAKVQARQYDGILPVVSGLLPGESTEEIVLCGHYDEFGADDNCSQIAVGLEVVRALRGLAASGEIAPLKRSIRLLFPMEARGFNALVQNREEIKNIRLGLNIDTVGTDQNWGTAVCTLMDSFLALPSFAEDFLQSLLERTDAENPLFRWRRTDAEVIDNIFGEPLIGAPTPCLYHYSKTHHLHLDTPDHLSERTLFEMARVAATYAGFVARASLPEACWLGELTARTGAERIRRATGSHAQDLHTVYARRLPSARWLTPGQFALPEPGSEESRPLVGPLRLLPQEAYDQEVPAWRARLDAALADAAPEPSPDAEVPPSRCVPLKTFRGYVAFEDVFVEEGERELQELGFDIGWGAPMWLQEALMLASGKRTAGEIAALLGRHDAHAPDAPTLERIFAFLVRRGHVRLRPYLTQADVRSALEEAGLAPGDVVLGHFSLSRFGYIEGGPDALIDTLLALLGPDGTLMMPAFAQAWLGHSPFDAAQSPSRVGAVTDRFWRRPGARRSLHPTHSFAAIGSLAEQLLADHDHTQPPLGAESPINRLAQANGKILMFAPKKANTSMHVGEFLADLPFVDLTCAIWENGARREVVVPRCPWHVNFEPAYEWLYAQGLVRDAPLGESEIYVMRCADAIAAQEAVARETPEVLLPLGCDCPYCRRLAHYCEERGRR